MTFHGREGAREETVASGVSCQNGKSKSQTKKQGVIHEALRSLVRQSMEQRFHPWKTLAGGLLLLCIAVCTIKAEVATPPAAEQENGGHLRKSPFSPSPLPSPANPSDGSGGPVVFSWEPLDTHFGILFPAIELAEVARQNSTKTAKDTGPNALGAFPNSPYLAAVYSPANVRVRLEMSCEELMEPSAVEVIVETAGQYGVVPLVKWKTSALRAWRDKREVEVTWSLSVNGKALPPQKRRVMVEPVNILPLAYNLTSRKDQIILFHYAAAYANENHPGLEPILKEALETGIVDRFSGMPENDPKLVKEQVLAIWWALQKRGIVYSDISATDIPKDSVFFAQRVRFFEDVINSQQANCIDGTMVFAALLRRIGLYPVICVVPRHAFLGFYLDKEKKHLVYLETTALNNRSFYVAAKERAEKLPGRLPKGIFPETENQTCPTTPDVARVMFGMAMDSAEARAQKEEKAKADGEGFFYRIDLAAQRKFIAPISPPKEN